MNKEEIIKYWIESSDNDFATMQSMYKSKHYSWCLFIGHLVIEKLLKAYYFKAKDEHPPKIHNLLRLAIKSELTVSQDDEIILSEITTFNINARYYDYKREFYNKCTKEFTFIWYSKIKSYRKWIKAELLK